MSATGLIQIIHNNIVIQFHSTLLSSFALYYSTETRGTEQIFKLLFNKNTNHQEIKKRVHKQSTRPSWTPLADLLFDSVLPFHIIR